MLPCECGNKKSFALPRECEMQAMDPTAHKIGSKRLCDGGDDDYVLIATNGSDGFNLVGPSFFDIRWNRIGGSDRRIGTCAPKPLSDVHRQ